MKLKRIKLINFGCHKKLDLNLDNMGLVLIKGLIGSGKSTIFRGIIYALFDKVENGVSIDELPNWHSENKTAKVYLWIEDNKGEEHIIKKVISPKGNRTLVISKEKTDAESHWRSTEYKEKIKQIVGIDYETFINSTYVKQGDMTKLVTGTNSDRNNIFSKFQDIPVLEKARKLHSQDYEQQLEELEEIKQKKQSTIRYLSDLKPKTTENTLVKIKATVLEINKKVNDIKNKSVEIKQIIDRLESDGEEFFNIKHKLDTAANQLLSKEDNIRSLYNEIATLKDSIPELLETGRNSSTKLLSINNQITIEENKIKNLDILEKDVETLELSSHNNSIEKIELNSKYNLLKDKLKEQIKKKNVILDASICEECEQQISTEKKQDLLFKIKTKVSKLSSKIEDIDRNLKIKTIQEQSYITELTSIKGKIADIKSNKNLNDLQILQFKCENERTKIEEKIELIQKSIKQKTDSMNQIHENIKILREQKQFFKEKFERIAEGFDEQSIRDLREKHYELLSELSKHSEIKVKLDTEKIGLESKSKKIKKLRQNLGDLKEKEISIEEDLKYHEICSDILSKNGLRIHKIESMLDSINQYMSSYQSHFADSKIEFAEFGVDANGKIDLYIWLKNLSEPKTIKSLSGGEKELVAFPCILSVFSYIAGRQYSNVLFIDEGLVYLDEEHKSYVGDILSEIKNRGISVFIISHDSFIQDFEYDHTFNVANKGKYSETSMN